MADSAPQLVRDNTMTVTAKEGVEFLKSQGADHLVPEDPDKPQVQRDSTIQATVKDSEAILKDANIDQDIRTRGEQQRLQDITEEGKDDEPPRVPRDLTIKETTKEAQGFLGDTPIGETRSQTQQMVKTTEEEEDDEEEEEDEDDDGVEDDLVDEVGNGDEEDDDVPNLKRTHTMAETLEEGEDFLKRQKTNGDVVEKETTGDA
ncbi:glutamic acid-rich protein-like [Asterias rubens]|uniref:glutamic acid-rich protein-like n=1 Tax=Asterias rubens TaxID=7604 RepID=UPI00145506A9|nr:glutamic acid-rich protein-like [Asterias rubens]